MADDALFLKCLIQGQSEMFRVKATGSMEIFELKELIHEQGKNGDFRSVDVKDLILWKVRMTMASDNTTNSPAG
jgi:hypothetical protein